MKKITKILPLAMALMLTAPVFAASDSDKSATSTMTLTVPEFIKITTSTPALTSSASFNDAYSQITLGTQMQADFTVVTNKVGDAVKISATALAEGVATPALAGNSSSDLRIVLTNTATDELHTATSGAITNALSSNPAAADNANAICFLLEPTVTPVSASGAVAPISTTYNTNDVTYVINNGKYDFSYQINTGAYLDTFSTHDTNGTYQAVLTLSQTSI